LSVVEEQLAPSQTKAVELRRRLVTHRRRHVCQSQDGALDRRCRRLSRRRWPTLLPPRSLRRTGLRAVGQVGPFQKEAFRHSMRVRDQWDHLHEDRPKAGRSWLSRCSGRLRVVGLTASTAGTKKTIGRKTLAVASDSVGRVEPRRRLAGKLVEVTTAFECLRISCASRRPERARGDASMFVKSSGAGFRGAGRGFGRGSASGSGWPRGGFSLLGLDARCSRSSVSAFGGG
jgi:hypothetical protein